LLTFNKSFASLQTLKLQIYRKRAFASTTDRDNRY